MRKFFIMIAIMGSFFACSDDGRTIAIREGNGNTGNGNTDNTDNVNDTNWDTNSDTNNDEGCSSLDILFIIDDSASMSEEQDNLAQNFPQFMGVLDQYYTPGGEPVTYKVGVTTIGVTRSFKQDGSTVSTNDMDRKVADGVLLGQDTPPEPNCGFTDPWIEGPNSGVVSDFNCVASVGLDGVVTEMPFAVIEKALGENLSPGQPNEGFYDPNGNSLLVVVIITDEDDCSINEGGQMVASAKGASDCTGDDLYLPQDTKNFLDNLAGPERYVVVGIAAHQQCTSNFGKADQASRIGELLDLCGDYGVFGDICSGDLWTSLKKGLDIIEVACRDLPPLV